MPLQHLIDCFNQRFVEDGGLHEPPLVYREGRVLGRSGGAVFTSRLRPVRLGSKPSVIRGYDATLRVVEPATDAEGAALGLFADEAADIVNLDRLTRTVHMLNFLPISHEGGYLFVHVHPRHILAVKRDHGAYFEEIIVACGLSPRRVVISLTVNPGYTAQVGLLLERLENYRARGYATAIKFDIQAEEVFLERYCVEFLNRHRPDFVRFASPAHVLGEECRRSALLRAIRRLDTRLLLEAVRDEADAALAESLRADCVQGDWYELAVGRTPVLRAAG